MRAPVKPRPRGKLIDDLMRFATTPVTGKGGWPNRLRAVQGLCLEAGLTMAARGRKASAAAPSPDLFRRDGR